MPSFPRYNSKNQLTSQQPSAMAPTDNTGAAIAEAGATIGGSVQKAAIAWEEGLKSTRKTVATVNNKKKILDIQQRASVEVDPQKEQEYRKELQKSFAENSKDLDNVAAMELSLDTQIADIQLQNLFKKKSLELDDLATKEAIDMEISNPTEGSFSNIKKMLAEKVATGHKTAAEADKLYKDSVKTIGEFAVANDGARQESDSTVLAELKKGDKGKYSEIPPDDRLSLIKASQQRIFNNNQTYKRDVADSQNERNNNLINKFSDGTATLKDIDNEFAIPEEEGGMKRSQLLIYKRALVAGTKGDLDRMLREKTADGDTTKRATAVKSYLGLIDSFIGDETDQAKAKEMLATAYEDGIINPTEQKFLNDLKQNLKDIEFNRSTSVVASAIRGVKDFLNFQSNASDEDIARNIKMLVGDLAEGKDPGVSARKILSQEVAKIIPDISNFPETGKVMRDANGNIARIYPDGTFEEVDSEKPAQ